MYKLPQFTYRWDCWLILPWGNNTPISLEQAKAYLAEAEAERSKNGVLNKGLEQRDNNEPRT